MPRAIPSRPVVAGGWAILFLGLLAAGARCSAAGADRSPPTVAIGTSESPERALMPPHDAAGRRNGASAQGSGGWWLGTVGIALALALFGGISLATRRYLPQHASGPLRVVGRTSLSPKHTVYLLKAGDRVLIVGAGPQGAPSLLGELTDPAEVERYSPAKSAPQPSAPSEPAAGTRAVRFERLVGGDE